MRGQTCTVHTHPTSHTRTFTNSHKFSHSAQPFLKPGLIFVWIIGLCAYRPHHIGRLKPYYRPIEWGKRFSTSAHSHALPSRFHKRHKNIYSTRDKRHTFSSWNAPRHDSESRGPGWGSQKFEAGSGSFILKAAVIIVCFSPLYFPPGRVNK